MVLRAGFLMVRLVCMGSVPRRDRACRRARGRQGRCAPLKRWPEGGPSLTAAARGGTGFAQVGTEGWCRSNRRMGTGAAVDAMSCADAEEAARGLFLQDFPLPFPGRL